MKDTLKAFVSEHKWVMAATVCVIALAIGCGLWIGSQDNSQMAKKPAITSQATEQQTDKNDVSKKEASQKGTEKQDALKKETEKKESEKNETEKKTESSEKTSETGKKTQDSNNAPVTEKKQEQVAGTKTEGGSNNSGSAGNSGSTGNSGSNNQTPSQPQPSETPSQPQPSETPSQPQPSETPSQPQPSQPAKPAHEHVYTPFAEIYSYFPDRLDADTLSSLQMICNQYGNGSKTADEVEKELYNFLSKKGINAYINVGKISTDSTMTEAEIEAAKKVPKNASRAIENYYFGDEVLYSYELYYTYYNEGEDGGYEYFLDCFEIMAY